MSNIPNHLSGFIKETTWTFAKTYAKTWAHEYIVRDKVDESLFIELVKYIRNYGHVEKFYDTDITYLHDSNMMYWTMGAPIEETIIINRCEKNQSYEYRLAHNDLPNKKI